MEERTEMVIGRKSFKIIGHFPPTENDPVLRLVFPREAQSSDKSVVFHLYLPGIPFPAEGAGISFKGSDVSRETCDVTGRLALSRVVPFARLHADLFVPPQADLHFVKESVIHHRVRPVGDVVLVADFFGDDFE